MKLTKEQITYIDDYLKHHKVKYWDIRIELLDHIVTNVEILMNEGKKFDKALEEVHVSFGNSLKRFWNSGIEYGVMENGIGYENLIEDKRKFLGKNYNRLMKKEWFSFFKSSSNLIVFVILIVFFFYLFQNLPSKSFVMISFLVPVFQLIFLLGSLYKTRDIKKSAILEIAFSQYGLSIFLLYNLIHFYNIFDAEKSTIAMFYLIVTIVQLPYNYANTLVLKKQIFDFKEQYKRFI